MGDVDFTLDLSNGDVDRLIAMIKAAMENMSSDENQDFIDKLRDLLNELNGDDDDC